MMFPTGFAVVFSGLLLRMRNEAQLAGVIAHESGHFLRRHMIRSWRDMRRKTDIFAIGAMAGRRRRRGRRASTSATMSSWRSSARSCRCSTTAATMEAEADAMGAKLIAEAGYPPIEMANIWEQLIGEEDAERPLSPQAPRPRHRCSTPTRRPMRAWPTSSVSTPPK